MSCGSPSAAATAGGRQLAADFASAHKWLAWVGSCLDRSSQRRALSALDDHLLKDIGITRLQALKEARKPAWRA